MRILVIEDNKTVSEMLKNNGFEITPVTTIAESIVAVKTCIFDVILLDLNGDGLDTIRILKENIPTIPIVVLTGLNVDDTFINTAMLIGIKILLTKPIEVRDLVSNLFDAVAKNVSNRLANTIQNTVDTLKKESK